MRNCLTLAFLSVSVLLGCSNDRSEQATEATVQVAFDSMSKESFVVPGSLVLPHPNPTNPKSQLKPALYCRDCGRWYPAPPLEVVNRTQGAGKCPRCKKQLTAEGQIPDSRLDILFQNEQNVE